MKWVGIGHVFLPTQLSSVLLWHWHVHFYKGQWDTENVKCQHCIIQFLQNIGFYIHAATASLEWFRFDHNTLILRTVKNSQLSSILNSSSCLPGFFSNFLCLLSASPQRGCADEILPTALKLHRSLYITSPWRLSYGEDDFSSNVSLFWGPLPLNVLILPAQSGGYLSAEQNPPKPSASWVVTIYVIILPQHQTRIHR